MTDQTRARLRRSLEKHEAVRHLVYDDATGKPLKQGMTIVGHPTIGCGRNVAGKGLRDDEVAFLLENDMDECALDLQTHFPWFQGLSEPRQMVVLELRFMLGPARFRKFKRMLAALSKGHYLNAAAEIRDSQLPAKRKATLSRQMEYGTWT